MINKYDDYSYSAIKDLVIEKLSTNHWTSIIDSLRPSDSLTINISSSEWIDLYLSRIESFQQIIRESVLEIKNQKMSGLNVAKIFKNMQILLVSDDEIEMSEINSKKEGQTICFETVVIGTDAPKTFIKETDVMCPSCFTVEHIRADFERKLRVLKCMNVSCRGAKMETQKTGLITEDIQTVLLQQPLEKATKNSPVIFYGKVVGSQVGSSFIGQKKLVVGIFRSNIEENKDENEVYIDVISLTDVDDVNEILPSDDEVVKIKEEVKEDDFINKLTNSFAPHIYGYNDIKLSCLLQLVGGVPSKKRADINILLVGDPSMAKSELLKYGNIISQRSIYTSGKGTTSAGLTIGMVKLHDGRMIAQAGVLPLCNKGHAFIDEFDKMNKDDRSSMHEAMEQQTVSIAKAGVNMTLDAKTSILAAANPKFGNYDDSLTLMDNINIPSPLLSRFDLIWLIKDKVSITEDTQKANHILDGFTNKDAESDCRFTDRELTGFINTAKKCEPSLTREVRDEIIKIYEKLRQSSNNQFNVGIRQLEALIRLSMAHAKLRLKTSVDVEDIVAVKDLLVSMYKNFDIDISGGGVQSQLFKSGRMTKEQTYHTIWTECSDSDGKVKLTDFFKKLEEAGASSLDATKLFHRWENTATIKLMADGTYKKTK
jgi:replicative DNA helicase Mcm